MAVFNVHKVIGSLPSQLEANCLYAVRTGEGFQFYLSDMTGSIAYGLNGLSGETDLSGLLSLPTASEDVFQYAIVVQNGILKRMAYSDMFTMLQPGFIPGLDQRVVYIGDDLAYIDNDFVFYDVYEFVDWFIYDNIPVYFGDFILTFAEDIVLAFGDIPLCYGNEALVYGA